MAQNAPNQQNGKSGSPALEVLAIFADSAQITFDRPLARRVLTEASEAVPGDDSVAWSLRLVDAGESLDLRVRTVECTLAEALLFVRQGTPVAVCIENVAATATEEDRFHWYVMTRARGRRIELVNVGQSARGSWATIRGLKKQLGLSSGKARARFVIGQAALACQAPGGAASGEHPSPLTRLAGLIRPEKKDLWVVLIFSLVVGILALASPVAVEALVNTVAFGRYLQPIVILAIILFTFLAFAAAMRALLTYIVEVLQRRLFIRVVEDLAYRLPRVNYPEFDRKYGPELVNRFFDVVTVQKTASALLLDGISIVLQTLIGMAVLAFYHPFLLGFDVVLLALIAVVVFVLGRGAVPTAIKESKAKYAIAAWLEEISRHTTAFKLHAGPQLALERADRLAANWLDMRRNHFRIVIRQIVFALGLQAVAATALLGLGGWLVILGELTLGQLVAAELIVMMIVGSFAKLGKHMESFYDLLASVDKLGVLFDLPTEQQDRLFHLRDESQAALTLYKVSYQYGSQKVLQDVSCEISRGETVALVGPPGAGKSTLIDLLCGLRSPLAGHIELDGIDLREIRPDSHRDHFALARGVEIFQGSIDENIHLNRPNIRAKDVRDALQAVGLQEEILQLPDGLNTLLPTDGGALSHNQVLCLMLARAIVGRPRLLMIDGTLDAMPNDQAQAILNSLISPDGTWTLLLATNRRGLTELCSRTIDLAGADSTKASKEERS